MGERGVTQTGSILDRIVADGREGLARRKRETPEAALRERFAKADRGAGRLPQFAIPHGQTSAHDGAHRPALDRAPRKRRPAAFTADPALLDDALGLEIDDRQIRVVANSDASLAGNTK